MSNEILLSPKEIAKRHHWPVARVRSLMAKQQIRHVRIGGGFFLPDNAIEQYLESHMVVPTTIQNIKTSDNT